MKTWWASLLVAGFVATVATARAADVGVVTIADAGTEVLRGTSWHRLPVGARLADGDIVTLVDRALVQIELADDTVLAIAGPATLYLEPPPRGTRAAADVPSILVRDGWLKIAAAKRGPRLRLSSVDLVVADAIAVVRASDAPLAVFVESGRVRVVERLPNGADGPVRVIRRGDYATRSASGAFAVASPAPKAFVDAMPKAFQDALPALAATTKTRPTLVPLREVTYAEAQPWLAGRDRAAFERRFAPRLRDPAFRKAVEPDVARYPAWDRQLHPEKYAPKPATAR